MGEKVIPVIDLAGFVDGTKDQKAAFVEALGSAFHNIGFVGVRNHNIPMTLIGDFYHRSHEFFALPDNLKIKYEIPGFAGQRGYTSFGTERAKGAKVADLKEFYQFGQEVDKGHPLKKDYPDNVIVGEMPQFTHLGMALYRAFENTGSQLLRAIALYLDLGEDYFDKYIKEGISILRAIHYPPITKEPENAIRAEQHEDINLITLLVGASAGGLQLLSKKGVWQNVEPEDDEIVINVGDMLQRLTNNLLRSTTHRVVNPPREDWHKPRLSIPFFLHPTADMDLTCLDNCVTDDNPLQYTPITAGGYLDERLREIGLKK